MPTVATMDVKPRPNILWRLFVLVGLGTAGAVTFNDDAAEQWDDLTGGAVPRDAMRGIFLGSVGLHALESVYVYGSARRNDIDKPGRWARSTLLWGFPVTRRLRKAKKQLRAAEA